MYGILSDGDIRDLGHDFISPFTATQVRVVDSHHVISYGTSSYGYDARLGNTFKVFTDLRCAVMDPKMPNPDAFVEMSCDSFERFLIPPRGYVLGSTIERFNMPSDVTAVCVGKSTFARSGLIVNVTPLEAGWCGEVTLEFMNALPIPVYVYPGEGICQFLFFRGERKCDTSYADRGGKYQNQTGVTLPRM